MSLPDIASLYRAKDVLRDAKGSVMTEWVEHEQCKAILERHQIDSEFFITHYAGLMFDYFLEVISGNVMIGECPVLVDLIEYLKNKEIRADELFLLCSHFKRSVLNMTYRLGVNDQAIFNTVSFMFDRNFAAVLKHYTDTIYQKEQEAINASRAKEYFLSNMSHEIRTPLNAILGFVSLLRDETTSLRHRKYLEIISGSGENLLQIINDILDFSKLRSGEFAIDPQPFNVHDEISHTMELFVPSANAKNITLTSFIDPSIPHEMVADALRINQIVSNFLSNAVKFSPSGGSIHVEARCIDENLLLSVRDEGMGIAASDQQRIFEPFSQAYEGMTRITGGTGLGLSISKQLAEHMGGGVGLISAPGKGSTFSVRIPVTINYECSISKLDLSLIQGMRIGLLKYDLSESYKLESLHRYWEHFGLHVNVVNSVDADCDLLLFLESSIDEKQRKKIIERNTPSLAILDFLDERYDSIPNIVPLTFPIYCAKFQTALNELMGSVTAAEYAGDTEGRCGFSGRVLVAEDNDANQELIRIVLQRYGLDYVIAIDGFEALERFKQESFDIVLMDEQMPRMNGNDATAAILAHERKTGKRHTPIVALTANVVKGSRERAVQNGYDAFLGKPIVLKEMEMIFRRYLECCDAPELPQDVLAEPKNKRIDMEKLKTELMLEEDQITYLLGIYQEKMALLLRDLHEAIRSERYESIAKTAHTIKGSSANFRFDDLSRLASVIEQSAIDREEDFDFSEAWTVLSGDFKKRFA